MFVGNFQSGKSIRKSFGRAVPILGLAGVVFGMLGIPIGELDFEFIEAKIFHHRERESDAGFYFRFNLRLGAEDVGVILGKPADAEQTVQRAAAFVTIDSTKFRNADRQIAIAAEL